jgi:hypothetical protein
VVNKRREQTSDEKTKTLDLFVRQVQNLVGLRLVTSGQLDSSVTIRIRGGTADFEPSQPDEEDLRSFLLTFRKFMLQDDPLNIGKIANLLYAEITNDDHRKLLNNERARYKAAMKHGKIVFDVDGTPCTPEENFDLWINAIYFHNDDAKAQTLAARTDHPISKAMSRHALVELLVEVTRYLVRLTNLILSCRSNGTLRV